MCMCLVLFVVSKILYSSELLSCLLEMGVEYCLVCTRYQRRTAVWEGRGATARPQEAKWSAGVSAVFWGILQQKRTTYRYEYERGDAKATSISVPHGVRISRCCTYPHMKS